MARAFEVVRVDDELDFMIGGILVKIPVTRRVVADVKATCPECRIESFQVGGMSLWSCPYCGNVDVPRQWEVEKKCDRQ